MTLILRCAAWSSFLRCFCVLLLVVVAACSSTPKGPQTYTVKRGDTLYSIAWRHRVDYHDLARWNGIARDYVIYPGQVLRLSPAAGVPKAAQPSRAPAAQPSRPVNRPTPSGPPVKWQWPVNSGKAILTTRPNGGQGLTVEGQAKGQDISAAADGRVVYSGSGLLGYGQLVIIKHSETYLSAYGHTQSVTVREGEVVRAGQRIATMGNGPQGTPMLYFEIRINGVPGNPLSLLPQRR